MTRLLHSEVLKITTTRGVWGFVLAVAAITAVSVAGQIGTTPRDILADEESLEDLLAAAGTSSLFALLAGVAGFTAEFRHGTVTQTFLVEPVRERVLAAKLVAYAGLGALLALVAVVLTLAISLPWLGAREVELDLGRREHLLILAGAVGSSILWGALGSAVGAIVRNQVFAIVAVLVWILILENLVGALVDEVAPYLPGRASGAMIGSEFLDDDVSRTGGTLLSLAYAGAFAAVAAVTLRRRDAV